MKLIDRVNKNEEMELLPCRRRKVFGRVGCYGPPSRSWWPSASSAGAVTITMAEGAGELGRRRVYPNSMGLWPHPITPVTPARPLPNTNKIPQNGLIKHFDRAKIEKLFFFHQPPFCFLNFFRSFIKIDSRNGKKNRDSDNLSARSASMSGNPHDTRVICPIRSKTSTQIPKTQKLDNGIKINHK